MPTTFNLTRQSEIIEGVLLYRESEYSIDFRPSDTEFLDRIIGLDGTASFSAGTLQIEVGVRSQRLLYVWGHFPNMSWTLKHVGMPPDYEEGAVVVEDKDIELERGVSIELEDSDRWSIYYDSDTKWIFYGQFHRNKKEKLIEFSSNVIGCFDVSHRMIGLWLRPEFVKS